MSNVRITHAYHSGRTKEEYDMIPNRPLWTQIRWRRLFWLTRLLAGLLLAGHPLTFGAAAIVLTAVALSAAFVPSQRATRVDPILALQQE